MILRPASSKLLLSCLGLLIVFSAAAHTLPISSLMVVSSEDYLHLELTVNPFELNFLSEFDADGNRVLDRAETEKADAALTEKILAQLVLKADGKILRAETAGIAGDVSSHHLTLRAHFPVAKTVRKIFLQSKLAAITSASHLTEVTFVRDGERQLARLDQQTSSADFVLQSSSAAPVSEIPRQASNGFVIVLLLASLPMLAAAGALLFFVRKHLREKPVPH